MTEPKASELFMVGETVELHYRNKHQPVEVLKVDGDDVTVSRPNGTVLKFKAFIKDGAMVPDEGFWLAPNNHPVVEPSKQSLWQRLNKFLDSTVPKAGTPESQNPNPQVWTPWPPH